jgi:hypothetical protein
LVSLLYFLLGALVLSDHQISGLIEDNALLLQLVLQVKLLLNQVLYFLVLNSQGAFLVSAKLLSQDLNCLGLIRPQFLNRIL